MRRLVIIGTAIACLGASAVAYAATHFNNYQGSGLVITKAAGSKAKPTALAMVETLKANAPAGDRAAPLTDIKLTIYGVKLDAGKLPVCSDAKIESNKTNPDGGCPKGSVIGGGPVHSELGSGTNPSSAVGTPCNPYLNVFNAGPKRQVFYFYTKAAGDCGTLTTGATAPYDGHISYAGGNVVVNVPLPPDISNKVANLPNYYGSLITETLTYPKKAGGKVYMAGIGCKAGKRAWTITFTNQNYGGGSDTQTVKGASKC
ncbi:MAG TPA: hypothetical protein VMD09_03835 [Solirubrobacteraceae bacterium]|nr:hypothetical protein [Solirubrobacteraceae bacterium]